MYVPSVPLKKKAVDDWYTVCCRKMHDMHKMTIRDRFSFIIDSYIVRKNRWCILCCSLVRRYSVCMCVCVVQSSQGSPYFEPPAPKSGEGHATHERPILAYISTLWAKKSSCPHIFILASSGISPILLDTAVFSTQPLFFDTPTPDNPSNFENTYEHSNLHKVSRHSKEFVDMQ